MGFSYGDDFGLGMKHGFQLWWLVGLRLTVGIVGFIYIGSFLVTRDDVWQ